MNDEEKIEAISACFTHALIHYGTFDDLKAWVKVAKRCADIMDKRLEVQHRQEIERRLMALESPTVINLKFEEIVKELRHDF